MNTNVLQAGGDPKEFRCPTVVVAAPVGFCGKVRDGVFIGPLRDTIEEAKSDAEKVEDLILEVGMQIGYAPIMHRCIKWFLRCVL